MDASKFVEIIERGEDSKHQFKETAKEPKKLADEMVAFSNSQGGMIIIGVSNMGEIKGLTKSEIDKINQHISNAATNNIRPAINVITENVALNGKTLIVVHVNEGINKPYCNNDGAFWVNKTWTGALLFYKFPNDFFDGIKNRVLIIRPFPSDRQLFLAAVKFLKSRFCFCSRRKYHPRLYRDSCRDAVHLHT